LFEVALTLDPQSVDAQSYLAAALAGRVQAAMADSISADLARAEALAGQALAVSPLRPLAHFAKGNVLRAQRRFHEAIPEYETALASNRNWVAALFALASCKMYTGSIAETIPLVERAIRLSPRDPQLGPWYVQIGQVHLLQSRTDDAITWLEKARSVSPAHRYWHPWLASAYALKGETERAAAEPMSRQQCELRHKERIFWRLSDIKADFAASSAAPGLSCRRRGFRKWRRCQDRPATIWSFRGEREMADKIRLGLIGASVTGTWSARAHLPAVRASSDIELTAVCTTRAESAEAARRAWGARLAFDDWRKMVASPEIEAAAVVVRVPSHYAPTKAALEAGKHVYCEWPLGRTTAEAMELAALAKEKGLVTAVGLQARVNPAVMHMKELVEGGFVGEVMAVHVSLLREGVLSRPSHRTWQRDAELGANTLTIANGHTVDAMRFVTGDFRRLSGVVATKAKQWLDTGTNTLLDVTAPDNVLTSGRLMNGAVASVHIGAIPFAGSGYRMEIYGRDGTLVATGKDSPQLSEVSLHGAKGGNRLGLMRVPERFTVTAPGSPSGEALNVGQMYTLFARAIRGGKHDQPNFETAVELHRLVDAIKEASDSGREVTFA
jgi:predicted dehydrogenase